MNALTPDVERTFDALKMELRGYEVARLLESGRWERVAAYRPNDTALGQAKRDAAWQEYRANHVHAKIAGKWQWIPRPQPHLKESYRVRPIISLDIDFAARPAPLALAADALLPPGELPDLTTPTNLDDSVENPQESLIVKPDGTEFAGTGFDVSTVAPGKPEVPFNYDELAGSINIPDPWDP